MSRCIEDEETAEEFGPAIREYLSNMRTEVEGDVVAELCMDGYFDQDLLLYAVKNEIYPTQVINPEAVSQNGPPAEFYEVTQKFYKYVQQKWENDPERDYHLAPEKPTPTKDDFKNLEMEEGVSHLKVNSMFDNISEAVSKIEAIVMEAHDFTEEEKKLTSEYLLELSQDGSPIAEKILTAIAENINI